MDPSPEGLDGSGDAKFKDLTLPEESKMLEGGDKPDPDVKIVKKSVNPLLIFRTISLYAISVYLIFTVTLACFPAVTCLIVSVNLGSNAWTDKYFVPVICFVVSNKYKTK